MLKLNFCGWTVCHPSWTWERNDFSLAYQDLWYIVRGRGTVTGPQGEASVRAGDAILYPPEVVFRATQDPQDRLSVAFAHFQFAQTPDWLASLGESFLRISSRDPGFLESLMRRSWASYEAEASCPQAPSTLWLTAALEEIRRSREAGTSAHRDPFAEKLERLCRRIRSGLHEDWPLERMAEACGVSPSYLTKVFRTRLGLSPYAYVIQARLNAARSLLALSNESVGQIAERLGYPDPFTFSKQFRKHIGLSPHHWRQR